MNKKAILKGKAGVLEKIGSSIAKSFPDWDEKEIEKTARKFYRQFCQSILESGAFHTNVLKNYSKVCNYIKFDIIFASNKTHHASHLNSAPGWVFDFYGGQVL